MTTLSKAKDFTQEDKMSREDLGVEEQEVAVEIDDSVEREDATYLYKGANHSFSSSPLAVKWLCRLTMDRKHERRGD